MQIFTSLSSYLQNLPLKKKMMTLITTLFLFFCIVMLVCTSILCNTYNQELYQSYSSQMTKVASGIQASMENIEDTSFSILSNTVIQKNLSKLNSMDINAPENLQTSANCLSEIYKTLHSIVSSLTIIRAIGFDINGRSLTRGLFYPNHLDMDNLNEKAIALKGVAFWYPEQSETYRLYCIREIREINYLKLRNLATLYIEVNFFTLVTDALKNAGYQDNENNLFLLTDGAEIIYSSKDISGSASLQDPSFILDLTENNRSYVIRTIDHRKKFITVGNIPATGWNYIYLSDYNTIFSAVTFAQSICLLVFFLTTLSAVLGSSCILGHIAWHFRILETKMNRFGTGDLTPLQVPYDYTQRQDEIGHLHVQFDQMVLHFKELVNDNYVKQILLQETQIQALQQQMNPHFLYNTLDSICWMAQRDHDEQICTMAQSLANLFRASITDSKELIPIRSELQFLDSYIQIQKLRFEERLDFKQQIPEQYMNIMIPRLCIQPLVENAIHHAMEDNPEVCTIQLEMLRKNDVYQIQVMNTGSFFEEHLLEKLLNGKIVPSGIGIGLSNIDKRFKLIYGEAFGLTLSNKNSMAVVALTLPVS